MWEMLQLEICFEESYGDMRPCRSEVLAFAYMIDCSKVIFPLPLCLMYWPVGPSGNCINYVHHWASGIVYLRRPSNHFLDLSWLYLRCWWKMVAYGVISLGGRASCPSVVMRRRCLWMVHYGRSRPWQVMWHVWRGVVAGCWMIGWPLRCRSHRPSSVSLGGVVR